MDPLGLFLVVVFYYGIPSIISLRIAQKTHKNMGITIFGCIFMPVIAMFISLFVWRDFKKNGHSEFRIF